MLIMRFKFSFLLLRTEKKAAQQKQQQQQISLKATRRHEE